MCRHDGHRHRRHRHHGAGPGGHFEANHFGADGGYGARWVAIKVGPLPFWFPNTQARVKAVRFHDLHHIVTGYRTDFPGETEISAWELATGCASHPAALVLNLAGLGAGLFFQPRTLLCAFARGRRTRNLYRHPYDAALLGTPVGVLRRELGLEGPAPEPTRADALAFAAWAVPALAAVALRWR